MRCEQAQAVHQQDKRQAYAYEKTHDNTRHPNARIPSEREHEHKGAEHPRRAQRDGSKQQRDY